LSNIYYDKVLQKKSLHVALTLDSHNGLKIECAKRNLSMQEVIEAFAQKLAVADSSYLKLLDEVSNNKILGINKKTLRTTEINNIYDILEQDHDDKQ
jgi:hypothetical protein